ncbi:MAG: universal stress protein [Nitrospiria bacterium]
MTLRRLLFATDFSEASHAAREHATELASRLGVELVLLHVFERPFFIETGVSHRLQVHRDVEQWIRDVRTEAAQRLETLAGEIRARGLTVTTSFREGVAFVEILKAAEETGADLIVLGTHGRTGLPHVLIGSVADRVVRQAPCAVLTVRLARPPAGRQGGDA